MTADDPADKAAVQADLREKSASTRACPSCGSPNPAGFRFCGGCGSSLERTCPSCSATLAAGLRFCGNCGAEIVEGDRTPSEAAIDEERNVVSILFADLEAATELATRLDPEGVREVYRPYLEAMAEEIVRHGGTVERRGGGAVTGIFGAPATHGDDPVRAGRAALAMQGRFAELNERLAGTAGDRLALRVAVQTSEVGEVLKGRGEHDGVVTGETTTVASHLQPVAPTRRVHTRDAVVSAKGLTKRYGELLAVDELTFSLEAGTVTGFLGPNGAGKTTTLRLLLGLAEPTGGEAHVFGRRYRELDQPARRAGAVLESNDFHPGRSGGDHLRALAIAAGIPPSRVDEVLELVELAANADRRVKTYSLGMRQRLGLAAALLGDPELLVLDEPTNGLDPVGVHWLRSFLRTFAEGGRTVLVSSHLLAEVAQAVDQVMIIDGGRLVAAARLDELTRGGQTLEEIYLGLTAGRAS